jgi:hypothetical protein
MCNYKNYTHYHFAIHQNQYHKSGLRLNHMERYDLYVEWNLFIQL